MGSHIHSSTGLCRYIANLQVIKNNIFMFTVHDFDRLFNIDYWWGWYGGNVKQSKKEMCWVTSVFIYWQYISLSLIIMG